MSNTLIKAAQRLLAMHDNAVFICGSDDESKVEKAVNDLRIALNGEDPEVLTYLDSKASCDLMDFAVNLDDIDDLAAALSNFTTHAVEVVNSDNGVRSDTFYHGVRING